MHKKSPFQTAFKKIKEISGKVKKVGENNDFFYVGEDGFISTLFGQEKKEK